MGETGLLLGILRLGSAPKIKGAANAPQVQGNGHDFWAR